MTEPINPAPKKGAKKTYASPLSYLWGEWVRPIGEAVIIALIVTTFLFTTVGIQGSSDLPTVRDGERVFVPKYETWLHRLNIGDFKRGDMVVLKPPAGAPQSERAVPIIGNYFPSLTYRPFFIKRVVALPGDKLRLDKGQLFVNGTRVNESHTVPYWRVQKSYDGGSSLDTTSSLSSTSTWPFRDWPQYLRPKNHEASPPSEITIPADHYFVMGDNRSIGGSEDSRVFGPVALRDFSGRATFVWWPPITRDAKGAVSLNWRTLPRPEGFRALERAGTPTTSP